MPSPLTGPPPEWKLCLAMQPESESPPSTAAHTRSILKLIGAAWLVVGGTYAVLLGVHLRFPHLQSGTDQIAHRKTQLVSTGGLFRRTRTLHVVAFGDSKTLSGFMPMAFDSTLAARGVSDVESFNFGIAEPRFLDRLERMIEQGVIPDVILLTFPEPEAGRSRNFPFKGDDEDIMQRLFPFRKLPRDVAILLAESKGSLRAFVVNYEANGRRVQQMERDRGYYFIARQSHFAKDELPEDLSFAGDTPEKSIARIIQNGPPFGRLRSILRTNNILCLFVPYYVRERERGESPAGTLTQNDSGVVVLGPDYLRYPNRYFSDAVHLNPRGAHQYTATVAELVADWLTQHPRAPGARQ